MKKLKSITTVYSYRFPEIRKIITELTNPFPHEIFLKATNPPGALDNFHRPVISKILKFYKNSVPHLKDFKFRYPTSGSEEGIREIMTYLQSKNVKKIYVLKGEYEGYKAIADSRHMQTVEIDPHTDPKNLEPGFWFISNPSARDGNIIPNKFIERICEAGHKVFYDLAYLGSVRPHDFDLSHENVFAAVVSFSKPFGLFYDRIGFTFSKVEIPSLYGNKWFKSILGLLIADKLLTGLKPEELYCKYKRVQKKIIEEINREFKLGMKPSDALLLGYLTKEDAEKLNSRQKQMIAKFQRGDGYRFCLTPYYLEQENNKA